MTTAEAQRVEVTTRTLVSKVAALEGAGTDAELAAHEADTTDVHGIADTSLLVLTSDGRLTNTRTPTDGSVTDAKVSASAAIAESKLALASDAAAGTASRRTLGTGATQAAAGNDSRLSDARTPSALSVVDASVSASAAIAESKLALASDAAAGTASRRTLGTGATQAAAGNDSRLSDQRVPTANSVDETKIADLAIGSRKLKNIARTGGWMPTGVIAANMRPGEATTASAVTLTSGTLRAAAGLVLPGGQTITSITLISSTTPGSGMSNQWFALYDRTTAGLIVVTADDTSTAWAANTPKTLALASSYTPSDTQEVWVVCCVVGTPPTLVGYTGAVGINARYLRGGNSNTGKTNPASAPSTATVSSVTGNPFYADVS